MTRYRVRTNGQCIWVEHRWLGLWWKCGDYWGTRYYPSAEDAKAMALAWNEYEAKRHPTRTIA